ncbi:MAG: OsmC family protein [Clostridia bacterium]|nr:OsmC family protein [Clostridia bacterium]
MDVFQNVNLQGLRSTVEKARTDAEARRASVVLEGSWNFQDGTPQFAATVATPRAGEVTLQADFPPPMGGNGLAPSAVQYCMYGAMACFASTFAVVAALEGVRLRTLRVRSTARVNFARFLGVGEDPVLESLRWDVEVESDASQAELDRLLRLAEERCPATWCLRNPVPVEAAVRRVG